MTGPAIAAERSFPFIVARGRSGTTLLRAMLDSHPDMAVPNESHFVVQVAKRRARYEPEGRLDLPRFTRDLLGHWAFRRWELPDDEVLEAFRADPPADVPAAVRTVYRAYARHHGKGRFADKTPSYVLNVGLLAATFPDARFVHMIRDGRDVALSYLDTDFGSRTLGQAALYWDRFVRAGRRAGARLGPDRYLEVRYEDLVAEPEPVLKELCVFVGLDFDERMLRFHERADELVPTLSHNEHHRNLYKPLTAGLRDWRRDLAPRDAAVFEVLAGELLDELGYEHAAARPGGVARVVATWIRFTTQVRRVAHGMRVRGRKLRRRLGRRLRRRAPVPGAGPARIPS
jgi:hypothetical protein